MADLIQAYQRHMKARGLSENTIHDRGKFLARVHGGYFEEIPDGLTGPIERDDIEAFLARDAWSAWTRATYYGHLAGFFRWAVPHPGDPEHAENRLMHNPLLGMRRPKAQQGVPKPVANEDLGSLLAEAPLKVRLAIALGAYQGLRPVQIAGLDREDITEEQLYALKGKGGTQLVLPTHPLVWELVKDLPPGPVVRSSTGGRSNRRAISSMVYGWVRRHRRATMGLMRACRHWFGTNTLRASNNLRTTQELMGHASPATTSIYTQITDEERRTAVAALPILG